MDPGQANIGRLPHRDVGGQDALAEQILVQIDGRVCLVAIEAGPAVTVIGILPQQYFEISRENSRPHQAVVEIQQVVATPDPPSGDPGAVKFDA